MEIVLILAVGVVLTHGAAFLLGVVVGTTMRPKHRAKVRKFTVKQKEDDQ